MIDAAGMVWGGLSSSCSVNPKNLPVVALQGNPLAPLWLMWQATGDAGCLDVAQTIVAATMKNLVWTGTEILQASSDADWNSQDQKWQEKHAGETPFKGIFAGFLGNFAASLATVKDPNRQAVAKA